MPLEFIFVHRVSVGFSFRAIGLPLAGCTAFVAVTVGVAIGGRGRGRVAIRIYICA